MPTYLVERYLPGRDRAWLESALARLRGAPSSALYLGDKPLYSSPYLLRDTATVPVEAGTYRLVTAVNHDGSIVGLSTRAHTEWTFASAAPSGWQSVLPLVDIDYTDVADAATGRSALDLANTAPASRLISLHLAATHQLG